MNVCMIVNSFFNSLATKQGERQPDRDKVMLPTCLTQRNAYEEYQSTHEEPFCFRHFQRVWKENFTNLKTSEVFFLMKYQEV